MIIEIKKNHLESIASDCLIIGIFEDTKNLDLKEIDITDSLGTYLEDLIQATPSCSKYKEVTVIHNHHNIKTKKILLLGLGKKETFTLDKLCHISAIAIRKAQELSLLTIVSTLHLNSKIKKLGSLNEILKTITEGAILGSYNFSYYKSSEKTKEIKKLIFANCNNTSKELKPYIDEGIVIGESVNFTKDLVNSPANYLTIEKFASYAKEIADENNINIKILDENKIKKENMNAFLAVGQGSAQKIKLIVLKYIGNLIDEDLITFVGKGIMFDSGGLSLKGSANIYNMHHDMAGAATVLNAIAGIAKLKLKVNILAVIPCAENMPSGTACRPGDIIRSMSGTTIEIVNTDAEGRLILVDAITYAQKKEGATHLVDVATLTGACKVALGTDYSGVFTNDNNWLKKVLKASNKANEKMWELPCPDSYLDQIKSTFADLKNTGGRFAGASTAALFIGQFAKDVPWVHIDIAGTSDVEKTDGYNYKGATGVGTKTLIELAKDLQKPC
ncbi:leucyl aminopeptidase [Selenomonadales bacterium OttesenSCG-928-I06]|nr:leucyl aminopeptidase [Selenomonadales bacterium OttesenSCG-928-I06]